MKFARVENNMIVELSDDPVNSFTSEIASLFITKVPDNTLPGYVLVKGKWTLPVVPVQETTPDIPIPAIPVVYPKVSPVEFKLLFTSAERVTINALKATDPIISDFYSIVDDPRLTYVDLGLKSTSDALDYFVFKNIITASRKIEILTGIIM